MAESTLTTTYSDIQTEVGREMGWGRTPGTEASLNGDWTSENFTDFGLIAKEGYRQFLYPEPLQGENKSHNWSFLYPLGTLSLTTTYSTGTIGIFSLSDDLNVTYTVNYAQGIGTTFPVWAPLNTLTYTYSGTEYNRIVTERGSGEVLHIESSDITTDISTTTGLSFTLEPRFYPLPDDFGGMASEGFTYRRDENWHLPDIRIVGEGDIRKVDRGTTGDIYPKVASLVPIKPRVSYTAGGLSTTAAGSRWAVEFYPRAEQGYEVEYRYHAIPPALDVTANIYHYGGAEHSSTIVASIVDVAYQKIRASNEKHGYFLSRLRQSILGDRRKYSPTYIGPGSKSRGDYSERDALREFRSSIATSSISTTFS